MAKILPFKKPQVFNFAAAQKRIRLALHRINTLMAQLKNEVTNEFD